MKATGSTRLTGLRTSNVRHHLPWLVVAVLLTSVLIVAAGLAVWATDGRIAMMDLLGDPAEVERIPWFIGAVHDLNLFVWAAGAALHAVAALGLRRRAPALAWALLALGIVMVMLALDDRFMLHEIVFPWILGLDEMAVFAIYAVVLAVILIAFHRVLMRQPELVLLVLGLAGLAVSVGLDLLPWDVDARRVAEETAKLFGAIAWSMFAASIIVRHLQVPAAGDGRRA